MAEHAQEGTVEEVPKDEEAKPTYSKLIVIVCLLTIMAYTVTCFVYLWNGKPLNDVLTGFFFGCFGIEFGSLAFIKTKKLKYTGVGKVGHVETREDGKDNANQQVPKP